MPPLLLWNSIAAINSIADFVSLIFDSVTYITIRGYTISLIYEIGSDDNFFIDKYTPRTLTRESGKLAITLDNIIDFS